ncbi:uncharacterized protein BDZ99DRAFT_516696 [Mytilinidion resinicola]|uniref:Uncharacterized protein n=1 Tax=Mytilinidion resinicola TaxID=574789 RepID=A0A6A6Z1M0_9PEZI|nr:uncharacterized protein BDZ99DRAFT_516696 [Mytilinidion resinicola]KAF2814075.1 hypothetical protein BDZ99DRAFT_516696 [Mytilinidion resinicola]
MARESHKNFANTGFRSHDTNTLRFTDSTKGGTATSTSSVTSEDPLDFLDTIPPEELEPPSSPFNLDLNSSHWITAGWILAVVIFLASLLYSYRPNIRLHFPLAACGYRTDHFSFLGDTPAEILGFSKEAVKLYDITIAARAPNVTASFDDLRQLIVERHAALEAFWFPLVSRPDTKSGLKDAQVEWIVERLDKAKAELLKHVNAVAAARGGWHIPFHTPVTRQLTEDELQIAAREGMPEEWLEQERERSKAAREGWFHSRPMAGPLTEEEFLAEQRAKFVRPLAQENWLAGRNSKPEGLKTRPVGT